MPNRPQFTAEENRAIDQVQDCVELIFNVLDSNKIPDDVIYSALIKVLCDHCTVRSESSLEHMEFINITIGEIALDTLVMAPAFTKIREKRLTAKRAYKNV